MVAFVLVKIISVWVVLGVIKNAPFGGVDTHYKIYLAAKIYYLTQYTVARPVGGIAKCV